MIARAQEIFEQARLEPEPSEPPDAPVEPRRREPAERVLSCALIEQTRAERQARHERVAGLFPAPEPTEWNVREIAYDRNRRARRRASATHPDFLRSPQEEQARPPGESPVAFAYLNSAAIAARSAPSAANR